MEIPNNSKTINSSAYETYLEKKYQQDLVKFRVEYEKTVSEFRQLKDDLTKWFLQVLNGKAVKTFGSRDLYQFTVTKNGLEYQEKAFEEFKAELLFKGYTATYGVYCGNKNCEKDIIFSVTL
jgi:hypothetical protein